MIPSLTDLEGVFGHPMLILLIGAAIGVAIMGLLTKLGWLERPSDHDGGE